MTSLTTPKETGRGADIPAPRGGQGVRLLVLGVDEDARLLRERAAAAGFELAQRYSARVSHVAYGSGVDPDDGRYAKIRDAGLALLPIQTCAAQLGLAKPAEPTVPAQAEHRLDEREREPKREPEPELVPRQEPAQGPDDSDDSADSDENDEFEEDDESRDGDLLDDPGGPDPLAYPPLEEEPSEPRPGELDPTAIALATAAIGADPWPTVVGDVEIEEVVSVVELIEVGEVTEATVDVDVDDDAAGADAEPLPDVAILDATDEEDDGASTASPRLLVLSVVWALIPLISLGLLTPFVFGYATVRTRSRLYAAATLGYALAVVLAFALSAEHPQTGSTANGTAGLLTFALGLSWLGGTGHALGVRTRIFGR